MKASLAASLSAVYAREPMQVKTNEGSLYRADEAAYRGIDLGGERKKGEKLEKEEAEEEEGERGGGGEKRRW